MQRMLALADDGRDAALALPPADAEVLPGLRWGRFDDLFTILVTLLHGSTVWAH